MRNELSQFGLVWVYRGVLTSWAAYHMAVSVQWAGDAMGMILWVELEPA